MEFNDQLKKLIEKGDSFETEKFLEEQLKKYPNDIGLLLKLCMTRINIPIEDGEKALLCINKIYEIDINNFYATILEYCIYDSILGGIEEIHYNKLKRLNNCSNYQLSIARYLMSYYWYFTKNDVVKTIELLKESIELCNEFVNNYNLLGGIYIEMGHKELGVKLKRKALENIKMIYPDEYIYDFTDVNEYINEIITGIYVTDLRYQEILEECK